MSLSKSRVNVGIQTIAYIFKVCCSIGYTLGATTFSITTFSLEGVFATLSISDTQHNSTQHNNTLYRVPLCCLVMLSVLFYLMLCWMPWRHTI